MEEKNTVYLIDGSSYIYRAFYAMRNLSTSSGMPTNAVYILCRMLLKLLKDRNPTHICFVLDSRGPTVRHERYEAYKATRQRMPEALAVQFPYILEAVEALGIPIVQKEGCEADDIIASASRRFADRMRVCIVTGDKDLMQLVRDGVFVWDTLKDEIYDAANVQAKYGVRPEYMADLLAIMGDSSDNVPGIKGVGEKGARELVQRFGHLEEILAKAPAIENSRLREAVLNGSESARLSLELVRLDRDVDLDIDLAHIERRDMDRERLARIFTELEFKNLLAEIAVPYTPGRRQGGLAKKVEYACVGAVENEAGLYVLDNACSALCTGDVVTVCLDENACLDVLAGPKGDLVMHDAKEAIACALKRGIPVAARIFDTMLAEYCLDASTGETTLEDLAKKYLSLDLLRRKDLLGSGRSSRALAGVDRQQIADFLAEHASCLAELKASLAHRMAKTDVEDLFSRIETPLMRVLAHMEATGVYVDTSVLERIAQEIDQRLADMEKRIYSLAGRTFNINSPKQLGEILFGELGLPAIKKTKTGLSTDSAVLEALATKHELPEALLEWRMLSKLKNTYVDTLPAMIDPTTRRVHTRFNQAVTATGRISSSDPNLQNIPVRSDVGRRIREAFRAPEGFAILSADYSQIELRILAHITKDPVLVESFEKGLDIHGRTASEIFGIPMDKVGENERRQAKTINFGIIYGMGPHKLSGELGIKRDVAKRYIDNYLDRYRGVRAYMEEITRFAENNGYVTTLMGRRRSIPEIASRNFNEREAARRIAINTPIQGSAADIIKLAMVRIHERLSGMKSRMILQVHDELVFEAAHDELDDLRDMVRHEMENAYPLIVPVHVDIGVGSSWAEAH